MTVFAGYDELLAFLHLRYHAPITVITPLPSCRLSNIAHSRKLSLIGIPTDESPSPPPRGFLADRRK